MRVLVTGAAGQDGAYLCRDLLAAGCHVHAGLRPDWPEESLWRLRELGLLGQPRVGKRGDRFDEFIVSLLG